MLHGDLRAEAFAELAFERGNVGIGARGGFGQRRLRLACLRELRTAFDLADGPALRGRFLREGERDVGVEGQQRTHMAHFELMCFEQGADPGRQFEQSQQVRHRRTRATDGFGRLLVGEPEFVDQARQRLRLLQWVEVFALDVLDQRHGDHRPIVGLAHNDWYFRQAGDLRGAPATLTRDDLVTGRTGFGRRGSTHHDRLDQTLRADRVGKLGQALGIHAGTRLIAAGAQRGDCESPLRMRRRQIVSMQGLSSLPKQRIQAAAETALLHRCHHVVSDFLRSRAWRRISPARPR